MYNTKYGRQAKAIRDLADDFYIDKDTCPDCVKFITETVAKLRLLAEQLEQSR
jgi:hypothetical protein